MGESIWGKKEIRKKINTKDKKYNQCKIWKWLSLNSNDKKNKERELLDNISEIHTILKNLQEYTKCPIFPICKGL